MHQVGQINKPGYVYILCNKNKTTLYVGVTSNLFNRIVQHKNKHYENSFSARYNLNFLVYYKAFETIGEAVNEEKRLKGGSRQQKIDLINSINLEWRDLFEDFD